MSAAAIGGVSTSAAAAQTPGSSRLAELNSTEFIKVLITELTNQDPFAPNDSQAILEQLSSLRNIESQLSLQKQLESLVLQNQIAQASGMIGKLVEGLDTQNNQLTGNVTSVRVVDGKAILELDTGKALPMDRVTRITDSSGT
jgi:flagellar basal-body rod modification protein FlgD